MASATVLDFQKFKVLMVDWLYGASMHHRAKFHQNRSYGCRDMAIHLMVFKMGAISHLRFLKFNFLTVALLNFTKISQTIADIWLPPS